MMLLSLALASTAASGAASFLGPSAAHRTVRNEVGAAMNWVPLSMARRLRSPLATSGCALASGLASGLGARGLAVAPWGLAPAWALELALACAVELALACALELALPSGRGGDSVVGFFSGGGG